MTAVGSTRRSSRADPEHLVVLAVAGGDVQGAVRAGPHGAHRYLDVLRAVALVRVVVYHTFGFAWIGFLFPSMGVMFALAGSLVARSLDRTTGARVVHNRVRRLLPSLWLLGVVLTPVMLLHRWPTDTGERPLVWYELLYWIFPIADPPGDDWAVDGTGVLWYVRAYLWFVLLSPFLSLPARAGGHDPGAPAACRRLHDRSARPG